MKLIQNLKELADNYHLSSLYNWEIPKNCPIDIPDKFKTSFDRNIYLKNHLYLSNKFSDSLKWKYWVIQQWGGIKSFKSCPKNDLILSTLESELYSNTLSKKTFNIISSTSKIASFMNPKEYAIYDSRVAYSLNWLLFKHTEETSFYPIPSGRNTVLSQYDLKTIFSLSDREVTYKAHQTAYFDYCELMKTLSKQVFNEVEPYYLEMLLFYIAPEFIVPDIKRHTRIVLV